MNEVELAVKAEQLRLIEIAKANLIKACDCGEPSDSDYWADAYFHYYGCPIREGGYELLIELGADLPARLED